MSLEPTTKTPRPFPSRSKKRRWSRRLAWVAFNLFVLLLFLYFGVPFAVNSGWLDGFIQRKIANAAEMDVRLQRLHMNGWSALTVHGLEMNDPRGKSAMRITAQRGEIGFRLAHVFSQPLESITVAGGECEMRVVPSDEPPDASAPFHWMTLPQFGTITLRNVTVRIHLESASMIFEEADADATDVTAPSGETRTADMSIRMKRFVWATAERKDALLNASITAHLVATRQSQLATLTASLGVADYLGASAAATLSYAAQELDSLRARVRGVDLAALEKRFADSLPKDFAARQLAGTVGLEIEADHITERGTGEVRLSARGENVGATTRLNGNDARLARAELFVEVTAGFDRGFRSVTFGLGTSLHNPEIAWRDFRKRFGDEAVKLAAGGTWDLDIRELDGAFARIKLPSAVSASIENATAQFGDETKYGATLFLLSDDLSALAEDWQPLINLRSLDASGKFALAATVEGDARRLSARGETQTDRASIRLQTHERENAPDSILRLFYALRDLTERTTFELNVPLADTGKGRLNFSTKAGAVAVEAPIAGEMEKFSGLDLRLNGFADLLGESVVIETAQAEVADFVGAKIGASLASKDKDTRDGLVRLTDVDLKKQWAHFRRLLPDFETTYAPSGVLSVTVKYTASKEGGERATVEFSGDQLTVVSSRIELPSGIEELKVRGTSQLEFGDGFKKLKTATKLTFADAIVYHDKLFEDFTGHEATVESELELDLENKKCLGGFVEALAKDAVKLRAERITADFASASFSARVEASIYDSHLMFEGLVKETFGELVPALKESSVSGKIALNARASFEGAKGTVRGYAELDHVNANLAGVVIENADGLVPIGITTDEALAERLGVVRREEARSVFKGTRVPAHLTIGKLEVGSFTVSDVPLYPRILRNRLVLDSPQTLEPATMEHPALDIPFLGGRFVIGDLSTADLLGSPLNLEATFALRDLNAAEFFRAAGLPQYRGDINSTPCRLVFQEDDLWVEGTLTAAVCNGTISLSNVRFVNCLSYAPVVGLEMEFQRLNLGELTSKLDGFGVAHGVVEGHARRVLVQEGRPYSLDLDLRTVPTEGVRQVIDRDAVRSLLILSTGERQPRVEPLLIFGGIKYRVFGIKCQINDDEVLIQGVEKRGDRHIVFDSALFAIPQLTIEVITGRPISYKDMLARLKAAAADAEEKNGEGR